LFDDLPDNVCPLSLPIYVNDRNLWADALENLGVLVGGWPSYHRGFDWKDFPEARHLKNDLITLPVHQDLELYHMEYIAECVQSIAEGHGHYYS
jgi:dTDP-4-amino-4,6-dideoxygalactose transaminase